MHSFFTTMTIKTTKKFSFSFINLGNWSYIIVRKKLLVMKNKPSIINKFDHIQSSMSTVIYQNEFSIIYYKNRITKVQLEWWYGKKTMQTRNQLTWLAVIQLKLQVRLFDIKMERKRRKNKRGNSLLSVAV